MLQQLLAALGWRGVPAQCAVCHGWPAQPICERCLARFAEPVWRCRTCALRTPDDQPLCGRCVLHPPPLAACLAGVDYQWPWSALIAEWKFRQQPGWAAPLAQVLLRQPGVAQALENATCLVPMPLSAQRLRQRGYNQALSLARRLAPGKVDAGLLLRIRDTAPQNRLSRQQRLANLHAALAVEPLRQAELRGARLLLVDDVMTSGASLHAAASTLLSAGAASVSAVVLARTDEAGRDAGHGQ